MPAKKKDSRRKVAAAPSPRRRAAVVEWTPAVRDSEAPRHEGAIDAPARISARPVMLLVLGPHRSGTSTVARALECLGAENSPELIAPDTANPTGYFEDSDINTFNDRVLLPAVHRAWHSIGPVDWSVLSNAERSRLGLQALEIVRRNYPLSRPLSVLKEPRIGALLPFWLSVLQHAGFEVRAVCAVRDPVSVARSLQRVHGLSLTHAAMIYLGGWLAVLTNLGELPSALVSYDELLAQPSKVLRRVADKLQLLLPADFEDRASAFATAHLDPSLRHSRVPPEDVPLEPDLPPLSAELYSALVEAVAAQNLRKTTKVVGSAERLFSSLRPVLEDFDRQFGERSEERRNAQGLGEQLQHQVHASQARVVELEQALAALQQRPPDMREAGRLASVAAENDALKATAAEQIGRLEILMAEAATRDAQLQEAQSRLASLEAEQAELVTRHQSHVTSENDLATRYHQLETAHAELAARHTAMVTSGSDLDARLDALEAQRQEAVARASASAEEAKRVAAEHAQLAAELASLRSENSELVTRNKSLATSENDLATRYRQLEADHHKLAARHAALQAERSELVARRQLLATNLQSLESKFAAGAAELSALRHRWEKAERQRKQAVERAEAAEQKLQRLQSGLAEMENLRQQGEDLEAKLAALSMANEKLAEEKQQIAAHLSRAEGERKDLRSGIDERFAELAKLTVKYVALEDEKQHRETEVGGLTRRVAQLEDELLTARNELQMVTASSSWRLTEPLRRLRGGAAAEKWPGARNLRRDYRLIKNSGLFDRDYYLRANPDVAKLRIDPIRHYLIHGAAEGRNPSADFNTRDYIRSHPELLSADSSANPLVHMILTRGANGQS